MEGGSWCDEQEKESWITELRAVNLWGNLGGNLGDSRSHSRIVRRIEKGFQIHSHQIPIGKSQKKKVPTYSCDMNKFRSTLYIK